MLTVMDSGPTPHLSVEHTPPDAMLTEVQPLEWFGTDGSQGCGSVVGLLLP